MGLKAGIVGLSNAGKSISNLPEELKRSENIMRDLKELYPDIENIPVFGTLDESAAIGTIFDCSSNTDKNTYIIKNAEL